MYVHILIISAVCPQMEKIRVDREAVVTENENQAGKPVSPSLPSTVSGHDTTPWVHNPLRVHAGMRKSFL